MICLQKGKLKSFKKRQNVLCLYLNHCTAIYRNMAVSGWASWVGPKLSKIDKFQKSSLFTHMWEKTKCIDKLSCHETLY